MEGQQNLLDARLMSKDALGWQSNASSRSILILLLGRGPTEFIGCTPHVVAKDAQGGRVTYHQYRHQDHQHHRQYHNQDHHHYHYSVGGQQNYGMRAPKEAFSSTQNSETARNHPRTMGYNILEEWDHFSSIVVATI